MCDYWTQPAPWAGPKSDREGESATGTTQGWNDLSGWVSGLGPAGASSPAHARERPQGRIPRGLFDLSNPWRTW